MIKQEQPSELTEPKLEAPAPPKLKEPSPASKSLSRFYKRLESNQLAQDLMRTGGGDVDTPFTETDLLRNFEQIAFFNEFQRGGGLRPSSEGVVKLQKWRVPVRISVEFGDNVPMENRATDAANVVKFANRLSRLTGHPIQVTDTAPNFVVMFMSRDDQLQAERRAVEVMPSIERASLPFFRNLPRTIQCFVLPATFGDDYDLRLAVAYIRSENTALQRLSCIHEELAQGLGLPNDFPRARPSIFNDDQEFALLTTHDEQLLRALYNPQLRPGMTLEEARPILKRIFGMLVADGAS